MKLEERARLWVLVWSGTNFGGGRRQRFAAFDNDRQGSGCAVGRSIVALAFLLEAQKTPCISSSAYTKDLDRQDTFFRDRDSLGVGVSSALYTNRCSFELGARRNFRLETLCTKD
ncbi:hypothetical protein FA13DRAFT_1735732 [Coprinellus micaceus]|uniref:Uncharacterized protein n=1 Tax=Coprinellus micaceus TaxID=71717 RepID=A0A4Y7T2H4_COPMI|nr:hypothetical protein FA13DRAFT_1735732 [Coprinellus micaceus]